MLEGEIGLDSFMVVGGIKWDLSGPAAVARCLRGSDVSFPMPGEIQGLEHCSSELYPEEKRAACPEEIE